MLTPREPASERALAHRRLIDLAASALSHNVRPSWLALRWQELRFDVPRNQGELMEALRLRHSAYSACGFIDPADFPLDMEVDVFDQRAVHFLARREAEGTLVGYTRLLLGQPLQLEDMVDIGDYRRAHGDALCEMSRLIVFPAGQRYVGRGLRHAAFHWAEQSDISMIVGISLERDEEMFTRMRFLPMVPRRRYRYAGEHFRGLVGTWLYGNCFDLAANRAHIRELLEEPGDDSRKSAGSAGS